MDKHIIFDLIKKTLRIKHKLKVFESMRPPETHEDIANHCVSQWELEDELQAIELQIQELRNENVHRYKEMHDQELHNKEPRIDLNESTSKHRQELPKKRALHVSSTAFISQS